MDKIEFANGVKYDCSFFAEIPGSIFIALSGVNISEAASLFSNAALTSTIKWSGTKINGFTQLVALTIQPYGIQATLKKTNGEG